MPSFSLSFLFKDKRILFFVILSLAISLRIIGLDKGYNSDEGWLLKAAGLDLGGILNFLTKGTSVFPPLSVVLMHFWMKLSNSEIWVRSYFVFFGVGLCILNYYMAKLYANSGFALVAFFVSAISPLLIWSSQFIRGYIDSAFWAALSIYFMLRLVKGRGDFKNLSGYVLFSTLALYSSYGNILILLAQNIFISIFYCKDLKFLKRWLVLQLFVVVSVAPCMLLLIKQIKLASSLALSKDMGFQLFGLHIGYYARGITATFGVDPAFLTMFPLAQALSRPILAILALSAFCIIGCFIARALKNLSAISQDRRLIWFFPVITVSALLLHYLLTETINLPAQAEYFLPQHVLFIPLISAAVYPLGKSKKINIFMFSLITLIFLARFPEAIRPEFDARKAYNYLFNNISSSDCLLMVRQSNWYIDAKIPNTVIVYGLLDKDGTGRYNPLSEEVESQLLAVADKHKNIYFYRAYTNDELLGANKLIMSWFVNNGYAARGIKKFRRIEIIHYERQD